MTTPTIDPERLAQITHLSAGAHSAESDERCLMEAVAWVTGGPHTSRPWCVSPVLAQYGRTLNDVLPDAPRQQLIQLIPLLPGTAGDDLDERRSYMALDWLTRVWIPRWLDLVPACQESAAEVRTVGPIVDPSSAELAGTAVQAARNADRALRVRARRRPAGRRRRPRRQQR